MRPVIFSRIASHSFMENLKPAARVCVSVCEQTASDLTQAVTRAETLGDIIELRLDCLLQTEMDEALGQLDAKGARALRPFILTLRPIEQGGRREINTLNRLVFWHDFLSNNRFAGVLADIELDLAELLTEKKELDWSRIICSHHDFSGAQADLENLYERMTRTPARILKIAVRAKDATDCIQVFQLLERARREGRELVALAMGEAGLVTRILGPLRGSRLTYGALSVDRATAPGQTTAEDLRRLYRVHKLGEHTQTFGIMGSPVAHSVSPHMHNAAFEETGVDAVYIPFEVLDAESFLRRMVHPRTREIELKLRGLSVTAPHKNSVMKCLDRIEPAAEEIGALNTIVVEGEELHGYNTDARALLLPLQQRVDGLSGKRVAVIGAGGAAKSALWGLRRAGARVTVFARDTEKARPLAEKFEAGCERLEGALFRDFDIVINATPMGTRGTKEYETPARAEQLRGARMAYDLVYNPTETRFLREAVEAGCETLGGLEMLVAQAAEQFKLWTKMDAPVGLMRDAAMLELSRQ